MGFDCFVGKRTARSVARSIEIFSVAISLIWSMFYCLCDCFQFIK